jgi:hypothetical protein
MNPATVGIERMRIEPAETGPTGIELAGIELLGIELAGIELVGGLGGGAAACAPPQLEQWS